MNLEGRPARILLVEDSPNDVELTRAAMAACKLRIDLSVTEDGEEAMEFLRREGRFKDATRPDLVLLDLNMPRMSGREVLAEMKADPKLKSIPVIVLTTSKSEEEVARAYDLHASSYIVKPLDFTSFVAVVKTIEQFWFTVVTLPPE